MATVYSAEVEVGSYNRIRIKCDYSGTTANLTIQFRRTSSYTTTWRDTGARLIFNNNQDKDASYAYTGTVGTTWVDLRPTITGYTISTSGGTYNWQFTQPAGGVLGCSGTITIPAQSTVPTKPTISATGNGKATNKVTYGTTSFGSAGSGTVYLYGGTATAPTTQLTTKTTTGNSTYSHSSLAANTKYYYRARAKSSVGWSSYSSEATAVTYGYLSSVSVSDYGTTTIKIAYTVGAGGGVYAQKVQYSIDGGSTWTTGATIAAGTTAAKSGTFTISNLTTGTTYTIQTRVSTTAGNWTGTTLTQKTAKSPTTPTVSTVVDGASTIKITYGTTSFGYPESGTVYLYWGTAASPTTQLTSKTTTGNSTFTQDYTMGLTANSRYYYRARALNSKDYWSNYSTEISAVTMGYATSMTVSDYSKNSITISYALRAGGGVYAQKVQYSIDNGTTWVTGATIAAGVTEAASGTYTISGLTSGTTYTIKTRVSSTAGNRSSTTLTQKTAVAPSGGTLTVTGKTYNSVTLSGSVSSYGYPEEGGGVAGLRDTAGSTARTEKTIFTYPEASGTNTIDNNSTKKEGGCDLYGCRAVYPFLWVTNHKSSATLVNSTSPTYLPPAPMPTTVVTDQRIIGGKVTASIRAAGAATDNVQNAVGALVTTEYRYDNGNEISSWIQLGTNESPNTVHDFTISNLPFETMILMEFRQTYQDASCITPFLFDTIAKPSVAYGSVNNVAKSIIKGYGSVNGAAKTITKIYGSENGVTKQIY